MSSLTLEDVCLTYGDGDEELVALDRVTLALDPGELVIVVGASGSGKSSLMTVAGALRTPDSGRVLLGTEVISSLSERKRAVARRERIGFVFQSSNLFASLTATEQLVYVARLAGEGGGSARPRAQQLLADVGLGDKADRRPGRLSGGERQRVGIARALMNEPDVLLVDEPTSALDHRRAREIVTLLRDQAHERGVATLMVTHDRDLTQVADRVVTMQDGRLLV